MYIKVNKDANKNIAYAGANIENPTDPNQRVIFDFIEMAILSHGEIFINTTRVDHFGFPIQLRLEDGSGYDKVVGERIDLASGGVGLRANLFSKFANETPSEFKSLIQTIPETNENLRIIAPAHGSFGHGENKTYLDEYIKSVWDKYKQQELVFTNSLGVTYTGKVQANGEFLLKETALPEEKKREKRPDGETYRIKKMPTTAEVLLGNGVLDDAEGTDGNGERIKRQLHIQAQLCAALNRRVAESPEKWKDHTAYYPQGQRSNSYSKFWHDHNIGGRSYGFAYDDVWDASSSLHATKPRKATITIGW